MRKLLNNRIALLLLTADTALLRWWFCWGSLAFSLWILFDESYASLHPLSAKLASPQAQVALFALHGFATGYGVLTRRYSTLFLFIEGLLGVFLWVGIGLAETVQQGVPGPLLICGGGISLFLLIRYPTHYEWRDRRK